MYECKLFDKEVCKGGYCGNTEGSYECYCTSGHYYDPIKLECTDVNECLDESICGGEECLNTEGSYICLCKPPMVYNSGSSKVTETDCSLLTPQGCSQTKCCCILLNSKASFADSIFSPEICWQKVTETKVCMDPLNPYKKTTFTECCCRYGEGWGLDCALCPDRNSGAEQKHTHKSMQVWDKSKNLMRFWRFCATDRYSAFEGLQAEECGILNGCENGRCVRVQEGYTCECFEGYTLDLSRMVCVDVNECLELNTRMLLCKNGKCINTAGSYQCECLPGYRASDKPNFCVKVQRAPDLSPRD
uniref:Latent-transforming growth factor beta-binding protein 1-like n=1 Tax=Cyprinodon variegatus TaxID=28743 RepID=A0A3Q2FWS2_CYPVA